MKKDIDYYRSENREIRCRLQTLSNTTFDGILIHEGKKILEVDETFLKMTGYEESELIGRSILDLVTPDGREKVIQNFYSKNTEPFEITGLKKDGTNIYLEIKASDYPYKDRMVRLITFRNITSRKKKDKKIEFLAYHDELTGLPNRLLFNRRLKLAMTSMQLNNSSLAVLFCDCDGFKKINDTLGHNTGDSLLKEVSKRLQKCLKEEHTVSRVGGDEFTILLPNTGKARAAEISEVIIKAFEKPFYTEGNILYLTTSVGISLYPLNGDNEETLIKNADTAMYEAKRDGKNGYKFYSLEMSHKNFNLLTLENEMRTAIDKNELYLSYQPQVSLQTGDIVGVEALIRWNHRDMGVISPVNFIPIAEKSGLILPIGEWVLKTACLQSSAWREKGYLPLRISVNYTAKQFQQPDVIDNIKRILDETNFDPNYLEIEITELAALGENDWIVERFDELKDMGIKVDVDDFGTGYCSFSYLKNFPIYKLKIDKSFIRNIHEDRENQAITEAIIRMGKGLGLKVIAEGIETEEELDFLYNLNCDEAQGFFFSKPLINEDFEYLLENGANLSQVQ